MSRNRANGRFFIYRSLGPASFSRGKVNIGSTKNAMGNDCGHGKCRARKGDNMSYLDTLLVSRTQELKQTIKDLEAENVQLKSALLEMKQTQKRRNRKVSSIIGELKRFLRTSHKQVFDLQDAIRMLTAETTTKYQIRGEDINEYYGGRGYHTFVAAVAIAEEIPLEDLSLDPVIPVHFSQGKWHITTVVSSVDGRSKSSAVFDDELTAFRSAKIRDMIGWKPAKYNFFIG